MKLQGASQTEYEESTILFTLRLWRADRNGHWEWRGRVQNVMSGEVRYFREWPKLIELVQAMLPDDEQSGGK